MEGSCQEPSLKVPYRHSADVTGKNLRQDGRPLRSITGPSEIEAKALPTDLRSLCGKLVEF